MAKFNFFQPKPSQITSEVDWNNRRDWLKTTFVSILAGSNLPVQSLHAKEKTKLNLPNHGKASSYKEITRYNNYYEFTTEKNYVHLYAKELKTRPWTITIEGEVEKPMTIDIDQLIQQLSIEERLYSMRCVEGWSMVIPWNGFALSKLLAMVKPTSNAKFVQFKSLLDPHTMIGQRRPTLDWPYTEGLRIDEAMNPLTLLATGIYGKTITAQNGAPLRLVVPWKYGFKSLKAITHISLTEKQPITSWFKENPNNYGFYANVNPNVSTPMWNQRKEVRIGELRKKRTQLFNGYAEQVAHLYSTMDLTKFI